MKKLLILLFLTACASTGAMYTQQSIPKEKAQLIIYRPSGILGGDQYVEINGIEACRMASSSYFTQAVEPGLTTISINLIGSKSNLTLDTKTGKRYYIMVRVNGNKTAGAMFGGLIGAGIVGGPDYFIEQVSDEQGRHDLATKKETITCKN